MTFYAQNFVSVGITPLVFVQLLRPGRRSIYDPLFSYYAVINVRQNPAWVTQVREQYVLRRDRVELRPPATYAEQTRIDRTEREHHAERDGGRSPRRGDAAEPGGRRRWDANGESGTKPSASRFTGRWRSCTSFGSSGWQQEREGARERAAGGAARPRPMNLPHSPIAARPARPAGARLRLHIAPKRPTRPRVRTARKERAVRPRRTKRPGGRACSSVQDRRRPRAGAGRLRQETAIRRDRRRAVPAAASQRGRRQPPNAADSVGVKRRMKRSRARWKLRARLRRAGG